MKQFIALAAVTVLTACGGGGGDAPAGTSVPPSTAAATSAEGFWNGTATDGTKISLGILETGETWGLSATARGTLLGVIYGNVTASGTSLAGTGSSFDFTTRTGSTSTFIGSFTPKSSITFTPSGQNPFNASYDAAYDQPALLANLAGTYTGFSITVTTPAQSVPVTISSTGNISASYNSGSLNCSTSGTAIPRASGKNIFNIQLTFSGNYCALGNGATASGIAYYDTVSRQLIAMALNPAKTDGFIYVGSR